MYNSYINIDELKDYIIKECSVNNVLEVDGYEFSMESDVNPGKIITPIELIQSISPEFKVSTVDVAEILNTLFKSYGLYIDIDHRLILVQKNRIDDIISIVQTMIDDNMTSFYKSFVMELLGYDNEISKEEGLYSFIMLLYLIKGYIVSYNI
jgi:hypothetical protein|uniref:Uncharacterized protein n=1 Tax=Ackermannviridae sp. ctUml7 TaxID=2825753 RepID=A0A8S5V9Q1_9CAUD|nr:MAG TPA: hypothetical protein [Ackermannviridae sp. ctUml7]